MIRCPLTGDSLISPIYETEEVFVLNEYWIALAILKFHQKSFVMKLFETSVKSDGMSTKFFMQDICRVLNYGRSCC
jgi:hypothetical protein